MIDETDQTVIVCMDFVKGKCHRDMKCKYYHPEAHLIVSVIKPKYLIMLFVISLERNQAPTEPIIFTITRPEQ